MSETPAVSTVPTVATKKDKRPVTLVAAAVILVLSAILTFASPWVPRPRGFGTQGTRTGQTQTGGGSANGGQNFGNGNGAGTNGGGQNFGNGGGGFTAGGAGGFGAGGTTGTGSTTQASYAVMARAIPIARTAEGIIGGIFTLIAAVGVWQRRKWGMVLALIGSVVSILVAALTLLTPVVGRAIRTVTMYLNFVTLPSWLAIVFLVLAVIVIVLMLLPTSRKGYLVAPKERRVM